MERYRNLAYLENQLEMHHKAEQDKFEETEQSLRQMQARMREEQQRMASPTGAMGGDDGFDVPAARGATEFDDPGTDSDDEFGDGGQWGAVDGLGGHGGPDGELDGGGTDDSELSSSSGDDLLPDAQSGSPSDSDVSDAF